jgi:hypothetical protein
MAAGLSDHVWGLEEIVQMGRQLHAETQQARPLQETSCVMTATEILDALNANIGRRVRVTFEDGVVQSVEISSVDEEGFLHSGPDGTDSDGFWTRFESVTLVEPEISN